MVYGKDLTELDNAPAMRDNCPKSICNRLGSTSKGQWDAEATPRSLPQQGGQETVPKPTECDDNKNWGFPKGCKPYPWTRDKEYDNKSYGNGVLVVRRSNRSKEGAQLFTTPPNLAGGTSTSNSKQDGVTNLEPKEKPRLEISYRQLWDIELLKKAYLNIKANPGNMTPGADNTTLDGISLEWAEKTIQGLKDRTFQLKPAKRTYIPKKNGMRPLGIPCPRDKVIQQAYKMILEAVYEPIFMNTSHGFRPNRSPHTAIYETRK